MGYTWDIHGIIMENPRIWALLSPGLLATYDSWDDPQRKYSRSRLIEQRLLGRYYMMFALNVNGDHWLMMMYVFSAECDDWGELQCSKNSFKVLFQRIQPKLPTARIVPHSTVARKYERS